MNAPAGRIIADRAVLDGSMLSTRERQVLASIAGGYGDKETAFRLGVSFRTVTFYRAEVRRKTGACSRRDLVLLARSLNLEPV